MGGGAAIRAAAKVAGVGVASGIRPTLNSIPPPAEHSVRSASRPVSAILTSSSAAHGSVETSGHQRPAWELDDWEFSGDALEEKGLMVFDSAAAAAEPRVVFGSAPSLSEAKEATNDLKDAIEKVFLTSAQNGSGGAKGVGQTPALTLLQNPDHFEVSGGITWQSTATPLHAMKAFTLLNETPAVQCVVGSIASGPNVWEAVLKNEALTSFLETQKKDSDHLDVSGGITCQSTATPSHAMKAFTLLNESPAVQSVVSSIASDPNVWEAVLKNEALTSFLETQKNDSDIQSPESPRKFDNLPDDVGSTVKLTELSNESSITENSETKPVDILDNIKKAVVEMATNVSSFVQNLLGFSSAENASDSATDEKAKTNFMDNIPLGASFMALVVMVIMTVVMKRA